MIITVQLYKKYAIDILLTCLETFRSLPIVIKEDISRSNCSLNSSIVETMSKKLSIQSRWLIFLALYFMTEPGSVKEAEYFSDSEVPVRKRTRRLVGECRHCGFVARVSAVSEVVLQSTLSYEISSFHFIISRNILI